MKSKKVTLDIQVNRNGGIHTRKIDAFSYQGLVAVHKTHNPEHRHQGWAITHEPTGQLMMYCKSLKLARKVARDICAFVPSGHWFRHITDVSVVSGEQRSFLPKLSEFQYDSYQNHLQEEFRSRHLLAE